MKAAFEALEIPTWHWVTMSENPADLEMWRDALQAKLDSTTGNGGKAFGRKEFDGLLSDWGAVTDQPTSFLAEDVINAYPEAKVVLVERDADRWYKSYNDTVISETASPVIPFISLIDKTYVRQMAAQTDLIARYYFNILESRTRYLLLNNPKFFAVWRERAKSVYLAHNEKIKRITPKDRLLVFKLEDGWEPLCAFLNKPVPSVPFPKVNETAALQEKVNLYLYEGYKRGMIGWLKRVAPIVVVAIAVLIWWKRQQ